MQHCSIIVRGLSLHFRTTAIGLWQLTRGDLVLCIQESALLRSRLFQANLITPPPISASSDSHRLRDRRAPRRVFQILANSPARKTLFSWPNENYDPDEFGKLASNVRIDSPVHSTTASPASSTSGGSTSFGSSPQLPHMPDKHHYLRRQHNPDSPYAEVRTSCTRRYKSLQTLQSGGVAYEVESIFIPHGSVIFACHQIVSEHPAIPAYDSLTSTHIPTVRPASQPWTLKPHPPSLSSILTEPESQPRYSHTALDYVNFNSSHTTPTSATTLSSGYPATPAEGCQWYDWPQDLSAGTSAIPRKSAILFLAFSVHLTSKPNAV